MQPRLAVKSDVQIGRIYVSMSKVCSPDIGHSPAKNQYVQVKTQVLRKIVRIDNRTATKPAK